MRVTALFLYIRRRCKQTKIIKYSHKRQYRKNRIHVILNIMGNDGRRGYDAVRVF